MSLILLLRIINYNIMLASTNNVSHTSYFPFLICSNNLAWSSSQNGGYPTSNMYSTTPQAHTSTALSYGSFLRTSGER